MSKKEKKIIFKNQKKMKHLEEEREALRTEVINMWNLVSQQLNNAGNALLTKDVELAKDVTVKEKKVDAFELNIDSSCENYIALYSPVAIDLRCVLALLRINGTLERIGDFANSIARFTLENHEEGNADYVKLLKTIELQHFFEVLTDTLDGVRDAFVSENTSKMDCLYQQDDVIDELYRKAIERIADYTALHAQQAQLCISLAILARKMERIGDHCNNIVEDIVFYLDARVTKHVK